MNAWLARDAHRDANEVPRHLAARVFHAADIVGGGVERMQGHAVRVNPASRAQFSPSVQTFHDQ